MIKLDDRDRRSASAGAMERMTSWSAGAFSCRGTLYRRGRGRQWTISPVISSARTLQANQENRTMQAAGLELGEGTYDSSATLLHSDDARNNACSGVQDIDPRQMGICILRPRPRSVQGSEPQRSRKDSSGQIQEAGPHLPQPAPGPFLLRQPRRTPPLRRRGPRAGCLRCECPQPSRRCRPGTQPERLRSSPIPTENICLAIEAELLGRANTDGHKKTMGGERTCLFEWRGSHQLRRRP